MKRRTEKEWQIIGIDLKIHFSDGESSQNTLLEGESRTHLKLPTGMYPENNTVSSLKVMHSK
jgi:hypothetical protein